MTYFTPCSSVSIVNFEHVNVEWVVLVQLRVAQRDNIFLALVSFPLGTLLTNLKCFLDNLKASTWSNNFLCILFKFYTVKSVQIRSYFWSVFFMVLLPQTPTVEGGLKPTACGTAKVKSP